MNQRSLAALVFLNLTLLVAIIVTVMPSSTITAQVPSAGNFAMIATQTNTRQQDIIYVLDKSTGQIAAFIYNGSINEFEIIGGRSIKKDAARLNSGR